MVRYTYSRDLTWLNFKAEGFQSNLTTKGDPLIMNVLVLKHDATSFSSRWINDDMIYFEFNHGVGAFVRCLLFESAVGASMLGNAGLTSKSKSAKSKLQGKSPLPLFCKNWQFVVHVFQFWFCVYVEISLWICCSCSTCVYFEPEGTISSSTLLSFVYPIILRLHLGLSSKWNSAAAWSFVSSQSLEREILFLGYLPCTLKLSFNSNGTFGWELVPLCFSIGRFA